MLKEKLLNNFRKLGEKELSLKENWLKKINHKKSYTLWVCDFLVCVRFLRISKILWKLELNAPKKKEFKFC